MARFTGKSIIVTGAGSGIGRATALLFAREGGSVIVADQAETVEETADLIDRAGGTAHAIRIDAGNEEDVVRAVNVACEYYGGLDVMFANAGISGGMANIFDTDVALITEVLRVNLIGPFLAIKHAAPKIAERGGGAIVLTASVAGIRSSSGRAHGSRRPAAVRQWSRSTHTMPSPLSTKPRPSPTLLDRTASQLDQVAGSVEDAGLPFVWTGRFAA
jgi:NAD(P)-dependent dehydrogenase (short-subunit alcohol dehydrogenase family)